MAGPPKKWSHEEKGQPVVKGDLVDLYDAHDKKLKTMGTDIGLMMLANWLILGMLLLFVFAPELWRAIKSWVTFLLKWMPM